MTLMFGGVSCVAGSLVFAGTLPRLLREVRPIYARLGILPRASLDAGE
jgi:hypothetical protein